jgi:hypothetical protein
LDIYISNDIDDPVRPASEIKWMMEIEDFFKGWFKHDSEKATLSLNLADDDRSHACESRGENGRHQECLGGERIAG